MTTILTPLGCSRFELNSEREQADTRENPAVVLQKNSCATPWCGGHRSTARSSTSSTSRPIGHGDRGDRRHRRGRSSLPRRPAWTALPRRAVYGGADRAGLIFSSFFFLGLLLFHFLLSLLPHFFEVIGFRLTRFPS